jgi:hypothetical protein
MVMIMKGFDLFKAGIGLNRHAYVFLAALMAFANSAVFAAEHSIPKTTAPGAILILSNSDVDPGVGFATFSVLYPDIPEGTLLDPKQLLEIRWNTTYYPQTLSEIVELCYFRPFSSQRSCERVTPNSSGTSMFFNDQPFGHGSKVEIRHTVLGGVRPYARPAGADSVTFRYRY